MVGLLGEEACFELCSKNSQGLWHCLRTCSVPRVCCPREILGLVQVGMLVQTRSSTVIWSIRLEFSVPVYSILRERLRYVSICQRCCKGTLKSYEDAEDANSTRMYEVAHTNATNQYPLTCNSLFSRLHCCAPLLCDTLIVDPANLWRRIFKIPVEGIMRDFDGLAILVRCKRSGQTRHHRQHYYRIFWY